MTWPADELRTFFAATPDGVVAAYLFGSQARGSAGSDSDVDVAVLYATPPARTLLGQPFQLEAELSALVQRPVQLLVLHGAPVDLIHRVLRDGVLLLDRDPSKRIAFEVATRNAYFDLKPILDRYRQAG